LVQPPVWTQEDVFAASGPVIVVDGVQDPGNAGAILRVAEAFEASGALWLQGSASPYHPKTLRASAGSCFRVPLLAGVSACSALSIVASENRPLFAAMPHGADSLDYAPLSPRCAIAIGAEGRGVSPELAHAATSIRIPTRGVESLNAAVAAAILLYEAWRQRRHSL
jgi:TrmH family RNA methyltransferase